VLILLPPSEGKSAPRRGSALDLATLGSPALTEARTQVLDALIKLCQVDADPDVPMQNALLLERAAATLGLGTSQGDLVHLNAQLRTSPATRAD